ncbi:MAG: hypothetical protein GXO88_00850 [Chlorobi bacterium]|nr:hypothetical protein [Chlorobiota bacterium]
MKKYIMSGLLIVAVLFSISCSAQNNCKVLMDSLKGTYNGKCKKGLAHGLGKAVGADTYEGRFRKGYPDGKGVYTWASGDVYDGTWKMGQRDGEGVYRFAFDGHDSIQSGIWRKDVYKGPKPQMPRVTLKEFVTRYSFRRDAEGDRIFIDLRRDGQANIDIEDFSLISSSGNYFETGNSIGIENVVFPVLVKIKYVSWNAAHTSRHNVTFEFEIFESGKWQVVVNN